MIKYNIILWVINMKINLSLEDNVKVYLTNQGEKELSKIKNKELYNYYYDEFGYLNIKLWALMQIFGPAIEDNKNYSYFDDEITIIKKNKQDDIKININDNIITHLTNQGSIKIAFTNKFMYHYTHEMNGKITITLYELMQIFGNNIHNINPFDGDLEIITEQNEKRKVINK